MNHFQLNVKVVHISNLTFYQNEAIHFYGFLSY